MDVTLLRARIRTDQVEVLEAALGRMFTALDRAAPAGVRYASSKLPDGVTFVILLALEDPARNPLPDVPEFQRFQAGLPGWLAEPPVVERLNVVGSYRLF